MAMPRPIPLTFVLAAVCAGLLLLSGDRPSEAGAAACGSPPSVSGFGAGQDTVIQGPAGCRGSDEFIGVLCTGGTVKVNYSVDGVSDPQYDSLITCGNISQVTLLGNGGDDFLDLDLVKTGQGFGITRTNVIDGGAGSDQIFGSGDIGGDAIADTVLARDGAADQIDCLGGPDTAQTDALSLDTVAADCETVDALPEPSLSTPVTPVTTTQTPGTQNPVATTCKKKGKKKGKKRSAAAAKKKKKTSCGKKKKKKR